MRAKRLAMVFCAGLVGTALSGSVARADRVPGLDSSILTGSWTVDMQATYSTCKGTFVGQFVRKTWTITEKKGVYTATAAAPKGKRARVYKGKVTATVPQRLALRAGTAIGIDLHNGGPNVLNGVRVDAYPSHKSACAIVWNVTATKGAAPVALGSLQTGVQACDEYIEKMMKCLDTFPVASRDAAKKAIAEMVRQWKQMPPAARGNLGAACQAATKSARDAYKGVGCKF